MKNKKILSKYTNNKKNKSDVVICIDAASSPILYPEYLKKDNLKAIHVTVDKNWVYSELESKLGLISNSQKNAYYKKTYLANFIVKNVSLSDKNFLKIMEKEASAIVGKLKKFNPIAVLPGSSQNGLFFAEILQQKLNLPHNSISTIESCVMKHLTQQKLKEKKINFIPFELPKDIYQIKSFLKKHHKIVIKPINDASTRGVEIITSDSEVDLYFRNNKYKLDEIFVEKYISGDEYPVNFVSIEGQHFPTGVGKYRKIIMRDVPLYDSTELLRPDHNAITKKIVEYVSNCLDAVGFVYGVSHSEVKVWKNKIYLIEINPRIQGKIFDDFPKKYKDISLQTAIRCYAYKHSDYSKYFQNMNYMNTITKNDYCLHVCLISNVKGKIIKNNAKTFLSSLKTFSSYLSYLSSDEISITNNLATAPGHCILIGSKKDVEKDHKKIVKAEMYEPEKLWIVASNK